MYKAEALTCKAFKALEKQSKALSAFCTARDNTRLLPQHAYWETVCLLSDQGLVAASDPLQL